MKSAFYISVLLIFLTCKSLAGTPDFLIRKDPEPAKKEIQRTGDEKAKILLFRLSEIRGMDRSGLTVVEKKELRKEVRSIKHQFRDIYRGSYISVGTFLMTELLLFF